MSISVKHLGWSALGNLGGHLAQLLVFFVLARLLNPADFGAVALIGVFIALVQLFIDQGFLQFIVQSKGVEQEGLSTAFWANLALGCTLSFSAILCRDAVAACLGDKSIGTMIGVAALGFTVQGAGVVHQAMLLRKLAFRELAKRQIISVLFGGATGVSLAWGGYGAWSLVIQQLVVAVTGTATLWLACPWRPALQFRPKSLRGAGKFWLAAAGLGALDFANKRLDKIIINRVLGANALGVYTVASRVPETLTVLFSGTITRVGFPSFSNLSEQPEALRDNFYKAITLAAELAYPAFIGLAVIAPSAVTVLMGEQWLPGVPIVRALCVVGLVHALTLNIGSLMLALGRPHWRLVVNGIHVVSNVALYVCTARYGLDVLARAYAIRAVLLAPLDVWVALRLAPLTVREIARRLAVPGLKALLMGLGVLVVGEAVVGFDSIVVIGCQFASGLGIYILITVSGNRWVRSRLWDPLEISARFRFL